MSGTTFLQTPENRPPGQAAAYGKPFWRAYVANFQIMVAVALLFRYANFVTHLGGDELHLGWIVGVGMVGSLFMRLALGVAIDHYGPRIVWVGSVLVFSAACFAHLAITSYQGPAIYLVRIVFCSALAGVFGASMTFVSARVPTVRMAEMIGMLGTSGFLGIVAGTQLGDLILGTETIERWQVDQMFLVSGTLGIGSAVFAYLATWGSQRPKPVARPPLIRLLRRYMQGMVFMIGIGMGIGLSMPGVFLAAYAAKLNIVQIGLFFGVYAPVALVTRILTRRLPERFGTTPMILTGIGGLVVSPLLLLLVDTKWMLIAPGLSYGISHALLFPSVVAAGTRTFPSQHRGLATTLMMGTWDVGALIGAPTAGAVLHYSVLVGLRAYPSMFVTMSGLLAIMGTVFAVSEYRRARTRVSYPDTAPVSEKSPIRSSDEPAPFEIRLGD